MIVRNQKINKTVFWILFAFLIVTTSFFNYKGWNIKTYIYLPFYAYFLWECFVHRNRLQQKRKEMHFRGLIKFLMVLPIFCFISYFANGDLAWQSHPTTFIMMCGSITFILYYVLHALNVNERTIITLFVVLALCIFAIQVLQQFNPGGALFGVPSPNAEDVQTLDATDNIEQRNGLYRFRVGGTLITIMALCYTWQKVMKKVSIKNIVLFGAMAASMYLLLTRQYMIATIGMCVFSVFLTGKTKMSSKIKYLIPIALFLFVLYMFQDALFGDLLEQTQNQTENSDTDIRTYAFAYYWGEIISHPLTFLFGAGPESGSAAYASQFKMFWVDIGLVGQWFAWGVGAILSYIYILVQIFFRKKLEVPGYVRFFAFLTLITSMLIYPYRNPLEFMVWACAFYLIDLHTNHSPLALK